MKIHALTHGQLVRCGGSYFRAGSIEGYSRQYQEDPQARLDQNAARAAADPYTERVIAWLNAMPVVIMSEAYAQLRAQKQSEEQAAPEIALGDVVTIEGRSYFVTPAANDNLFLAPVEQGEYGHGQKTRHPARRSIDLDALRAEWAARKALAG